MSPLPFLAVGTPDRARRMRLEVVGRLPRGAMAVLEMSLEWAQLLQSAAGADERSRGAPRCLSPSESLWSHLISGRGISGKITDSDAIAGERAAGNAKAPVRDLRTPMVRERGSRPGDVAAGSYERNRTNPAKQREQRICSTRSKGEDVANLRISARRLSARYGTCFFIPRNRLFFGSDLEKHGIEDGDDEKG